MEFNDLSEEDKQKVLRICKEMNKQQFDNYFDWLDDYFKTKAENNVLRGKYERFKEQYGKKLDEATMRYNCAAIEAKELAEFLENEAELFIRNMNSTISRLRKRIKLQKHTRETIKGKIEKYKKLIDNKN